MSAFSAVHAMHRVLHCARLDEFVLGFLVRFPSRLRHSLTQTGGRGPRPCRSCRRGLPGPWFLGGALDAFIAAEMGLVDLDRTRARIHPFALPFANPMGQVPRVGLEYAEVAMECHTRDALEDVRKEVNGHGPSPLALASRCCSSSRVSAALPAAILRGLAGGEDLDIGGAAGRAAHAAAPNDVYEPVVSAVLRGSDSAIRLGR